MSDVAVVFPEICRTGRITVPALQIAAEFVRILVKLRNPCANLRFPVSITKEFYMSKVSWRAMPLSALLIACFLMAHLRSVSGDEWQPVTQEELKMTGLPEAPG